PMVASSAAWTAAQSIGATSNMDYKWVLQISQVEELQGMFMAAQTRVFHVPPPVSVPGMQIPGSRGARTYKLLQLGQYLQNMRLLAGFGSNLERAYASALKTAGANVPK